MTNRITTEGPEARAALAALTSVHYFNALKCQVARIESALRLHVTYPKGEPGLTDYDVPVGDALDRMLADARGDFVTRPVVDHMPMDPHELAFELGTVEQLRTIADAAECVRNYAAYIADLLQEERFGGSGEEPTAEAEPWDLYDAAPKGVS
jgi:hypothetical protein